jgi:hypothetical protein
MWLILLCFNNQGASKAWVDKVVHPPGRASAWSKHWQPPDGDGRPCVLFGQTKPEVGTQSETLTHFTPSLVVHRSEQWGGLMVWWCIARRRRRHGSAHRHTCSLRRSAPLSSWFAMALLCCSEAAKHWQVVRGNAEFFLENEQIGIR